MRAFRPSGQPVKVTVSASASTATKIGDDPVSVRIANTGTATIWVKFGGSSVAATTSDYPVPAGVVEVVTPNTASRPVYVSVIASGATGDAYFNGGTGI